ncbi:DUF1697 domain-containing protein [Providencia rettgeri]|nr:DUF1697 domain-containing protein [Providencia rettgeri]
MNTQILLLRGVMPTGKNKVLMAPLRAALEAAGLRDVRTYIQSGNAIVSTQLEQPELEQLVHYAIKENLGGDIQVIARTPAYFMQVMANNPFKDQPPSQLYFTLLRSPADSALLHAFHALEHEPDQVRVIDDIAYIVCATRYGDLKANNNFIEKKLKVVATTRNFNTMSKLIALSTGN